MSKNTEQAFSKEDITELIDQVHKVAERYHCHSARVQRLSYDTDSPLSVHGGNTDPEQSLINVQRVQGLSFAQHRPFGEVVLKWQLRLKAHRDNELHSRHESHNLQVTQSSLLSHEGEVLQQLAGFGCSAALLQLIEEHLAYLGFDWHLSIAVLPYYPLGSLKQYLKTQPLNKRQKTASILAAAQALWVLHQAGWIHGDIKPSNFLLAADHLVMADQPELQLLINDFALAEPIAKGALDTSQLALTAPKGTPAYLAPECWQGQGTSVQSDIYAFGIMVFEVLTGSRPYQIVRSDIDSQKKVWHQWAVAHCQQPIPRLPIAWQAYQSWLDKMLAKQKARRLSDIGEFIKAIE